MDDRDAVESEAESAGDRERRGRQMAALSYFLWPLILLDTLVGSHEGDRFVRFHLAQAAAYWIALTVVALVLNAGLLLIPFGDLRYGGPLSNVFGVLAVAGAAYCAVRAWQGEWGELPLVGKVAARVARRPEA